MGRFEMQPCDEQFFEHAPKRYVHVLDLPVPAERVWGALTGDRPLSWCRAMTSVRWTSPRPLGVGTTRTAKVLFGLPTLYERFFRWEDGRRKSFYAVTANLPLFRRVAEDYLVEPTSPRSCRFTWTVATEPYPATRFGSPVVGLMVDTLAWDTRRHFRS